MLKFKNVILSISLFALIFISCATFTKIEQYNKALHINTKIITKTNKINAEIVGFNKKNLLLANKQSISLSTIDTIFFDSVFISLPKHANIHFFINDPENIKFVQPYDLIYQYPVDSSKINIIFYKRNYSKVLVPHKQIGYIPLYIKNSELTKLSTQNSFFDFIFSNGYNATPLKLKEKYIKKQEWLWYFEKYKYPIKYLKALKAYIYAKPTKKSKIIKILYRGAEVFILDSTKYFYKVVHSDENNIVHNYIGYMQKNSNNFSDKVILNMTKEEAEKILLLQKRKKFIQQHKVSPQLENAILSGTIKEGMTKDMVLASWGNPYKKENKSKRYMFPYLWHYKKNGKHYILYFNKKGILKSIVKQ